MLFSITQCDIGADDCSEPNPCQNNGTCIESLPTGYQCNCTHGFEGQNCTEVNTTYTTDLLIAATCIVLNLLVY